MGITQAAEYAVRAVVWPAAHPDGSNGWELSPCGWFRMRIAEKGCIPIYAAWMLSEWNGSKWRERAAAENERLPAHSPVER